MRISTKVDYAVRAAAEIAAAPHPLTAQHVAEAQRIPRNFVEHILGELHAAGLVQVTGSSSNGKARAVAPEGYRLTNTADEVMLGDIIRAVEGPLETIRGKLPENSQYPGAADALPRVWTALRQNVRSVVEHVSLGAVISGRLPESIDRLAAQPDAWVAG